MKKAKYMRYVTAGVLLVILAIIIAILSAIQFKLGEEK